MIWVSQLVLLLMCFIMNMVFNGNVHWLMLKIINLPMKSNKNYFDRFVEASTRTKQEWVDGKITNITYFDKEMFYDLILNECLKYVRSYDINRDDVYKSDSIEYARFKIKGLRTYRSGIKMEETL